MMRSLYSGVAGLRTHQTKMDVLGNNIANVNTTSFKSQSISFSDLMYQTTQSASGATATKGGINARQIGLGAKSGAISTAIESQGATQTTNNPFDLMITGKAFFVVNNGKENLYTRDGSFYVDGAGNLAMQSNGYYVMGWTAQEDAETGEITVNKNGGLSSLKIMAPENSTYSPAATTAGLFSGNIDDNDTNVTSDDGKTITLEFYDNKGYLYTGKFILKDTGTDHLFSLQLKDIIDSNGNSIGKDLLSGVTFGETESNDVLVQDAYEVDVSSTKADVNRLAGATVYSNVPTTGTLYDLMKVSKNAYSGVLEKIYGISDNDVTSGTHSYDKNSAYKIEEDGTLTITFETVDLNKKIDSATGSSFTYTATNSNKYYVKNDGSQLAYQLPTSNSGNVYTSSKFLRATLENVYTSSTAKATDIYHPGTSATSGTTFADDAAQYNYYTDSSFKYAYKNKTSDKDTFAVYRTSKLALTPEKSEVSNISQYNDDFVPNTGSKYDTLSELAAGYTDKLYYTFTSDTTDEYKQDLTVYGSKIKSSATGSILDTQPIGTTAPSIYKNDDTVMMYTAENEASLKAAGLNLAPDLKTYMENNNYNCFKITNTSGNYNINFFSGDTTQREIDEDNVLYSGRNFFIQYTADETTWPETTPKSVFKDANTGKNYALTGKETTVADYSPELLADVYKIDAAQRTTLISRNVSINTAGVINIYHEDYETPTMNTDYATKLMGNGNLEYVTTNDTIAYLDVPLKGNITDLLQSADGDLKDFLYEVYGLTDEDADAYGTDGTYSINSDGSITLTTGTHTIQLVFDPANGGITTANGRTVPEIDLIFDQSEEGLEAFGFQPTKEEEEESRGKLTLDFSNVTNYNTNGSATIKAVKGDSKSLNTGRMVGEMNGITVSTDGQIYATYSNGQTKLLGQIASAEFANASGLAKEGDNLYSQTLNSGEATIQDITTDGGYMNTGVLEMSNVDLSKEFTEMITTQRGFQANSRIITVSDTLLEELTNLKR